MTNTLNKIMHNGDEYEFPGIPNDTTGTTSIVSNIWAGTSSEYNLITPKEGQLSIVLHEEGGGGWQPGVNTKLYLPLDGDVTDYSSYNRSFTVYGSSASVGTPVFDTLASGKQVADFIATTSQNSNWFMFIDNPTDIPNSGDMTLSFWMCFGGQIDYYQEMVTYRGEDGFYRMSMLGNDDSHYLFHGSVQENTSFIPTIGTWYHIVNVVENGVCKIYCDGNQIYSDSYSYGSGTNKLGIGGVRSLYTTNGRDESYNGKLSEVIIEDKARTAQEVADYYDQTKANYGL